MLKYIDSDIEVSYKNSIYTVKTDIIGLLCDRDIIFKRSQIRKGHIYISKGNKLDHAAGPPSVDLCSVSP